MSFHTQLDEAVDSQIEQAGESITITRDAQTGEAVDAIWGTTGSQADAREGATISSNEGTWIVRASEYAPDGTASTPAIGDRIVRVSTGEVYEVQRLGNGRSHFDRYGGRGYAYRVYVQRVNE